MSRIDELIAEYCPDGVVFRKLSSVCQVFSGFAFRSELFNTEGNGLPLIRIRDVNTGFSETYYSGTYSEDFVVKNGDILIGMDGDFRAKRWSDGEALLNQRVCRLQGFREDMVPAFMYYLIQDELDRIHRSIQGSTVKHLSAADLRKSPIPVPPLEVQREIVRILDHFTELEAELEAELESRRRQYEHYRESLFRFEESECEWLNLRQVASSFGRGKSRHRPRNDPRLYGGPFAFVQTGDIRNSGHLLTEYSQTYSEVGLAQSKLWPRGTICITIAANIAETAVLGFEACFPDSVIGMVVDPERASSGYVEYLLQSLKISLVAMGQGSAQANINLATFEDVRFPFPSLEEQERIAAILDKFDALVNDLSVGLPAELAARRKQYEHYRDRLLTFKELAA